MNTLRRCHSTVRGLRKSRAPISRVGQPVAGEPRDLLLLRSQLVARLDRRACAPSRRWPAARGGRARRTPPCPIDDESVVRRSQLLARIDAAILAAQPLAVEQVARASSGRSRVRARRSIASRYRGSAASPSLSSARERASDAQRPVGGRVCRGLLEQLASASRASSARRRSWSRPRSARSAPRRRRTAPACRRSPRVAAASASS